MKIFVSNLNESWIVDRFRNEWIEENREIFTEKIKEADIVWIISPWTWQKIPKKYLKSKFVICTIHHLEDKDFTGSGKKEFLEANSSLIRALLLSGIRAAFLWNYHGGSKWQLMFRRSEILNKCNNFFI